MFTFRLLFYIFTRAMASQIIWNMAGQPEPAGVAPFLDVTSDAWYSKAVAWCHEQHPQPGRGNHPV